jgi:hypothetical protein
MQRLSAKFFLTLALAVLFVAAFDAHAEPLKYLVAYNGTFPDFWRTGAWDGNGPVFTDPQADAPGRAEKSIEVRVPVWDAFVMADRIEPGWIEQWSYLNEVRNIEFDIYFDADSVGEDHLVFILEDAGRSDAPKVVSLIPGWSSLSQSEQREHWFHVVVDLAAIHPQIQLFQGFLFFNQGDEDHPSYPHFRLADVKLGWTTDTTLPVITLDAPRPNLTYDQLILPFSTDEACICRVEYGVGNYDKVVEEPNDVYAFRHTITIPNLAPGAHVQYRVLALGHRLDPTTPKEATYPGTFILPAIPTTPPVIASLAATSGSGSATITWTTDRPCLAEIAYQKNGDQPFTRKFTAYQAQGSVLLDLLEPAQSYMASIKLTDAFGNSATSSISWSNSPVSEHDFVPIAVDAARNRRPIDERIYGVAFDENSNIVNAGDLQELNVKFNRWGGDSASRYNWKENAWNLANDWYFESYPLPSAEPGGRPDYFIAESFRADAQPSITIPMIGWVAKLGPDRTILPSFSVAKYGPQVSPNTGYVPVDQWFPDAGGGLSASDKSRITNDPNDANVLVDSTFQQGLGAASHYQVGTGFQHGRALLQHGQRGEWLARYPLGRKQDRSQNGGISRPVSGLRRKGESCRTKCNHPGAGGMGVERLPLERV